jgi:2-oxo-3-hexenedioate decarboxylase
MILTPCQKSTPDSAMFDADRIAQEILEAWRARRQIPSLAARLPGFDLDQAYQVAAALRRIRQGRGERPVGRKIGFTNRTIWDEYEVYAPIWGDMYATTLQETDGAAHLDLSPYLEPRIEPEIAFGLARAPEPGMDEAALLGCIAWVAHGFEIVHSMFAGWRFATADTVAAFALHGAYRLGPRRPISQAPAEGWLAALSRFEISLYRNDELVDRGQARNVLDGPLSALRHLNDLLAADRHNPRLAAGEIITTGTVTRAFPVAPGETWRTELHGLDLPPMTIHFG